MLVLVVLPLIPPGLRTGRRDRPPTLMLPPLILVLPLILVVLLVVPLVLTLVLLPLPVVLALLLVVLLPVIILVMLPPLTLVVLLFQTLPSRCPTGTHSVVILVPLPPITLVVVLVVLPLVPPGLRNGRLDSRVLPLVLPVPLVLQELPVALFLSVVLALVLWDQGRLVPVVLQEVLVGVVLGVVMSFHLPLTLMKADGYSIKEALCGVVT